MFHREITILVVDDFASMRSQIRELLGRMKFENVIEARDGAEAVKILDQDRVDFIISDWNMPNMSGLELLREVRSRPEYEHVPFLMLTSQNERENVIEAVEARVSNYMLKPFSPEMLEDKIKAVLGLRGTLWAD